MSNKHIVLATIASLGLAGSIHRFGGDDVIVLRDPLRDYEPEPRERPYREFNRRGAIQTMAILPVPPKAMTKRRARRLRGKGRT